MNKKFLKVFGLVLLILIGLVGCGPKYEEGIFFKTKPFDEHVEKEFLLYYMKTSCPHCQKFRMTLNKYAKKKGALHIYAMDLDTKEGVEVARYFVEKKGWGLRGTPTIYYIKDGKAIAKFEGEVPLKELPLKGDKRYAK